MKYKIIKDTTKGQSFDDFEKKINEMILEGWKLQGGINAVSSPKGDLYWVQAMVKE
jgi:hypothetical protein